MAVPAPVSPLIFRDMLVSLGYKVVAEDEDNWALFKADADHPVLTIPRDGETVSLTVMMPILDRLKIDDGSDAEQ